MARYFLLLFIFSPRLLFSQCLINKNKEEIKVLLMDESKAHKNLTLSVKEKDSTATYILKGPGKAQTKYQCNFESGGICITEKITADCDTCIRKKLTEILSDKEPEWKKLNENQYISGFESKMMIELSVTKSEHSFTIRRIEWSQQFYNILTGN